jgi:hypothetical protein
MNPRPLQRGTYRKPPQGGNTTNTIVYMCEWDAHTQMRDNNYESIEIGMIDKCLSSSHPNESLYIHNPSNDIVLHAPKGVFLRSTLSKCPR